MLNPLHYQMSEYDCGPTCLLNAVSFLFDREELPPDLLRNIFLYTLDLPSPDGIPGKGGTSHASMRFLSRWFTDFGKAGRLPISSRYIECDDVFIGAGSQINEALQNGGIAVVRLWFDVAHYVLLTGVRENGDIEMFDPYYCSEPFDFTPEIEIVLDRPTEYNRVVPPSCFNRVEDAIYALGKSEERMAMLIFRGVAEETATDPESLSAAGA